MIKFILLVIIATLLLIPHWIVEIFGSYVTPEQMLFHIVGGFADLQGVDSRVIIGFITGTFVRAVSISMLITVCFYVMQLKKDENTWQQRNPKLLYARDMALKIGNSSKTFAIMLLLSTLYFVYSMQFLNYFKVTFGEDRFTDLYVDPGKIAYSQPIAKKNLIVIYVESLEYNLRNRKIFGSNLIQPIDDLAGINMTISPAPGTGWSVAGMISSQCSVPLKPYYDKDKSVKSSVMPGLTCLGDILKQYGYKQYFVVGQEVRFAGMNKYYHGHGYDYTYGLKEWEKQGVNSKLFTGWGDGLQDDTLLEEAKKIIVKNVAQKQLYNLSILTTDSHTPEGIPSPRCRSNEKSTGFQGSFQCSSRVVANFINDLKANNLLDNTIVIVMGDHRFINKKNQAKFFSDPRNVYFKLIETDNKRLPTRNVMNHYDVAPSILDLLDITQGNNTKFGLGISIFSSMSANDYSHNSSKITDDILNHSPIYTAFWQPKK